MEMRTAIMLGLVYVGDAIGKTPVSPENGNVFAGIILVMTIMDIVDFFRGKQWITSSTAEPVVEILNR